jgi:ribosomal protein L35
VISPGQIVVLKPNFIRDFRETHAGLDDCVMTHGSIIRAAVDYVYIALGGRGRIIIADAPQNDADFAAIRRIAGLDEIQEFYRRQANFKIEVCDLRPERAEKVDGIITGHTPLPGDPEGYVKVDLGRHSMFDEIEHLCHLLYGSEYDTEELRSHHRDGRHEYLLSKTVLGADCVMNLPKLKTHKGVAKRVKVTKKGKVKRQQAWHRHLMTGKSGSRKRRLRRQVLATKAEAKRMKRLLGLR